MTNFLKMSCIFIVVLSSALSCKRRDSSQLANSQLGEMSREDAEKFVDIFNKAQLKPAQGEQLIYKQDPAEDDKKISFRLDGQDVPPSGVTGGILGIIAEQDGKKLQKQKYLKEGKEICNFRHKYGDRCLEHLGKGKEKELEKCFLEDLKICENLGPSDLGDSERAAPGNVNASVAYCSKVCKENIGDILANLLEKTYERFNAIAVTCGAEREYKLDSDLNVNKGIEGFYLDRAVVKMIVPGSVGDENFSESIARQSACKEAKKVLSAKSPPSSIFSYIQGQPKYRQFVRAKTDTVDWNLNSTFKKDENGTLLVHKAHFYGSPADEDLKDQKRAMTLQEILMKRKKQVPRATSSHTFEDPEVPCKCGERQILPKEQTLENAMKDARTEKLWVSDGIRYINYKYKDYPAAKDLYQIDKPKVFTDFRVMLYPLSEPCLFPVDAIDKNRYGPHQKPEEVECFPQKPAEPFKTLRVFWQDDQHSGIKYTEVTKNSIQSKHIPRRVTVEHLIADCANRGGHLIGHSESMYNWKTIGKLFFSLRHATAFKGHDFATLGWSQVAVRPDEFLTFRHTEHRSKLPSGDLNPDEPFADQIPNEEWRGGRESPIVSATEVTTVTVADDEYIRMYPRVNAAENAEYDHVSWEKRASSVKPELIGFCVRN